MDSYDDSKTGKYVAIFVLVVVGLILGLITLFSSMRYVDTGHIGVVSSYGRVTGRELGEGFAWVSPWGVNNVTEYSIQTQKDEVESAAATKDLQDVNGTLVLNYQLQRGKVSEVHQTIGKDYKDKIILPALNEVFKAASAKYTAAELIQKRAEVKQDVYQQLKDRLEKYGVTVQDVSITNFTFSTAFNTAIEAVQIANQKVAQAQQELAQAKIDAETKIAKAKGDAEAQRLQQETLSPELLQKYAIDKWNGVLPTTNAGGSTIFSIPLK